MWPVTATPRTALVTGAAGFIGSTLCDALLRDGWRVVGLDNLATGREGNLTRAIQSDRFGFERLDLLDPGLAPIMERARPDVVFHLAAQAGVRPSLEDPRDDAEQNVVGTLALLETARAAGARKVVYAASGGTLYGESSRLPAHEDAAPASMPTSPYGISKKVVLDYLAYYERAHGIAHASLALGNVYGPRQDPHGEAGVVSIFGAAMLHGDAPAIFGDGEQTRDYVFVADVVAAFVLAADAASGALLNIGTGVETSVNTVYRLLAAVTGFEGEPRHAPLPAGEIRRIALDASRAREALGWEPKTSLDDGLRATLEWLRTC